MRLLLIAKEALESPARGSSLCLLGAHAEALFTSFFRRGASCCLLYDG